MRGSALRIPVVPFSAAAGSILIGQATASSHSVYVVVLAAAAVAVAATLLSPPHLFLGGSLVVLGTSSLSTANPFYVGPLTVYTTDLLLVLLAVRALSPRERVSCARVVTSLIAVPLTLWTLLVLYAGWRGLSTGNSFGQVARAESSLVYLVAFAWGFKRVAAERAISLPRVTQTIGLVGLSFIAFAVYTRITHQRFEPPDGSGVGNVITTTGVLRRDYGLFSAFELYALLALSGLTYLLFAARSGKFPVVVTVIALAALVMSLVRGMIFGTAAAFIVLIILAIRQRGRLRFARLIPAAIIIVWAAIPFALVAPNVARGVAERSLPGILEQTANATRNSQYRERVFDAGRAIADRELLGLGFVDEGTLATNGFPPIYIPHSQWGTLLALEGWPGVILLIWVMVAVVLKSSKWPAAQPWLHPLVVATAVLMAVQGIGWNILFSMVSGLGMIAMIVGIRFGLTSTERGAGGRY